MTASVEYTQLDVRRQTLDSHYWRSCVATMTVLNLSRSATVSLLYFGYFLTLVASCWIVGIYFVNFGLVDDVSWYWSWFGIAIAAVTCALIPILIPGDSRPSAFILHAIALLIVAPSLVLFTISNAGLEFLAVTLLCCATVALVARIQLPVRPLQALNPQLASLSLLLVCIAYFGALLYFGQAAFFNLNMFKVYELRDAAAANLPSVFNYLLPWVSKSVATAGIALAIYQRNFLLLVVFSVVPIGIFAFGAHKEPVLFPFIVAATYYFACNEKRTIPMLLFMLFGGYLLMADSAELARVVSYGGDPTPVYPGMTLFADFLLRRGIMVPALLNSYFIDFFSGNGHLYWWSGSRFTLGLLPMPYPEQPPYKIGFEYFNSATMSANAGWIGSGFANGHVLGALIYSMIVGLILSLMDAIGRYTSRRLVVAMFIAPMLTLIMSGDLFTSLLTHGLLPTILIALLVRAPEESHLDNTSVAKPFRKVQFT